jgi:hypothetical protein
LQLLVTEALAAAAVVAVLVPLRLVVTEVWAAAAVVAAAADLAVVQVVLVGMV